MRVWPFNIRAALLALALCGCGSSSTAMALVAGRVLKGGRPLATGAGESLVITFCAEDGPVAGAIFPGVVKSDGSFEVPGPQQRGIPAGRYRIAVALLAAGRDGRPADKLRDAFSLARTPFVRRVTAGEEVALDLDAKP